MKGHFQCLVCFSFSWQKECLLSNGHNWRRQCTPFCYIFQNIFLSTMHTSLYPLLVDFFLSFSPFSSFSGCTHPQQILVCRHMWPKDCGWPFVTLKQSKSAVEQHKQRLSFPLPDFTQKVPVFSGRCVHGAQELRSGRTATVHAGGALQGQSVQHPCALDTSYSAVRPG